MLKNAFAFAPMLLTGMASAGCCDTEISSSCADEDSNQEEQKGCCTDDCHCVCCHTFYTVTMVEAKLNLSVSLQPVEFKFYNSYTHRFTHGVWQPPRLV